MPGVRGNAYPIAHIIGGRSTAAVTAALILDEFVAPAPFRIGSIVAYATTAGSGAGNTVIDVLRNGTTIWTTATDRPTLLGTGTGEFANTAPNVKNVQPGDRILVQVATVPATTGHARVAVSVALELA